jgi:lactoylglutathione lyase
MAGSAADWAKQDTRRMLHAVYRVGDLDAHVDFYQKHFGMKVRTAACTSDSTD